MINRIVAYGCSFTAGDELCEHEVMPNSDEIKKTLGQSEFTRLLYNGYPQKVINDMYLKQPQTSFPGILSRKLGMSLDNRAVAGSSLESIFYTLVKDLSSGNITESDCVIIGLTHVDRIIHISKSTVYSLQMAYRSTFPLHLVDGFSHILNFCSDETLFFNYYACLNNIIGVCQHYLPGRFFIVAAHHAHNASIPTSFDTEIKKTMEFLKQNAIIEPAYISEKCLYDFIETYHEEVHGLGHPKKIVHTRFAEYLFPIIAKQLFK